MEFVTDTRKIKLVINPATGGSGIRILEQHLYLKDMMTIPCEEEIDNIDVDGRKDGIWFVQIDWLICLKDYSPQIWDIFGMFMLAMKKTFRVLPIQAITKVVMKYDDLTTEKKRI